MRPYAYVGTGHRIHSHHLCRICSGQPREKATTRQKQKTELIKDLIELEENKFGYDFDNIWDKSYFEEANEDYYYENMV